jgi:hypothetical protein
MLTDGSFSARAKSLILLCEDPKKKATGCPSPLDRAFVGEDWSGRECNYKGEKVRYRAAAAYLRLDPANAKRTKK